MHDSRTRLFETWRSLCGGHQTRLRGTLGGEPPDTSSDDDGKKDKKKRSTGRRDLRKLPLEEERIEMPDPLYERLVADGKAKRIDFEESCKASRANPPVRRRAP
jgi:transposase